ncbi:hypothetical protein [Streptomyces sp. NPDC059134]|uniref:hypothetical protein n=1 Tax=Streptomyces sp. NPDC059134 TaxID=3346738 RepID=UPI003678B82F
MIGREAAASCDKADDGVRGAYLGGSAVGASEDAELSASSGVGIVAVTATCHRRPRGRAGEIPLPGALLEVSCPDQDDHREARFRVVAAFARCHTVLAAEASRFRRFLPVPPVPARHGLPPRTSRRADNPAPRQPGIAA